MNKLVNGIAFVVLLYSITVSTTHIVETSLMIGLAGWQAFTSPLLVDAVFALGKLGRAKRFPDAVRKSAFRMMLFGGGLSLTCNIVAGANWGQRIHGVVVVLVMVWVESFAAKLIDNNKTPAADTAATAVHATATVATPVQTVAPVNVPVMPAQPVPAIARAPRQRVAPAASTRTTVTATVPAAVNPTTGQPYSQRHARRLRTGR